MRMLQINIYKYITSYLPILTCACAGHSGYTPLHYAARSGHLDAVKLLIKAGTANFITFIYPVTRPDNIIARASVELRCCKQSPWTCRRTGEHEDQGW